MRDKLTTAAEVLGAISITTGAALVAAPLGLIVGGVFAIVGSYLVAE